MRSPWCWRCCGAEQGEARAGSLSFRWGETLSICNLQPINDVQENDPGEIEWEQFSLPELKNFLLILDREEAWYKRRIHEKYETVQEEILRLLHEKNREEAEKEY